VPAAEVKRRLSSTVVAVACGEHASIQTLKEITDNVLFMRDMSPDHSAASSSGCRIPSRR